MISIVILTFSVILVAANSDERVEMKVAIVGAGVAGLAGARRCREYGFQCDVFEMTNQIGGVWVYTDDIGLDQYGYPIHTAMYKGLRTNLPKDTMEFPGLKYPENKTSYMTQADTLEYLNTFADKFNLRPLIKLNTIVTDVRLSENNTWLVTSLYKPTKEETIGSYDAVMVCNGHFSTPYIPKVDGRENFKGTMLHSFHYRLADAYRGERVLVVGAGPSGLDITMQVMKTAQYVVLSHHLPRPLLPEISQKSDIKRIGDTGAVIFADDTVGSFDTIIFSTGYLYSFPFLHKSCGIIVEENCVKPLYKHLINIERPTMALVGLPFQVAPFPLMDLQVRYFCRLLNGSFHLPSKQAMTDHAERDMKKRLDKGWSKKRSHEMGLPFEAEYNTDLANEAGVAPISSVIYKLRAKSKENGYKNLFTFREHNFRVIDDDTYEEIL